MSPNGSVDIHVNGADDFQLDSCAPRSLFPLSNCHLKSILSITPRRVLSANCSLYGWAELIAEMFPLSGEALNTGKLVGCVSSSLPAAALLQQQLNNSEQHSTHATCPPYCGQTVTRAELGPDWADLLWKEHVMIVETQHAGMLWMQKWMLLEWKCVRTNFVLAWESQQIEVLIFYIWSMFESLKQF